MSVELSIIGGLGIVSFMLAMYAFKLAESESEINRRLAVIIWFFSLIFLDMIMFAMHGIAANNSAAYLNNGVLTTGMQVMMWLTLALVIGYFVSLMVSLVLFSIEYAKSWGKRGRMPEETR